MTILQILNEGDFVFKAVGLLVSTVTLMGAAFVYVLKVAQSSYDKRLIDMQALHIEIIKSKDQIIANKNDEIEYYRQFLKECEDEKGGLQNEQKGIMAELRNTLMASVDVIKLAIQDDKKR
jgi:hypothetical protein